MCKNVVTEAGYVYYVVTEAGYVYYVVTEAGYACIVLYDGAWPYYVFTYYLYNTYNTVLRIRQPWRKQ